MKTIVEALQDLYVAMGGQESDASGFSLTPDVIEKISQLIQSGQTKELPAVTAEDEGKSLMVTGAGEWGAVNNKTFIITLTPTEEDFSGTMDKTPAQIWEAYASGRRIVFSIPTMNALLDVTQTEEHDANEDGTNDSVNLEANIVYNISSDTWVMIAVITSREDSTYSTMIFPLSTS